MLPKPIAQKCPVLFVTLVSIKHHILTCSHAIDLAIFTCNVF